MTTAVGTYEWTATYNGDANNNTVTSVCGTEPVVITQATPTITTTPSAGGPVGSTGISDTATVSGGFTPTGNVTFNLFAPGDTGCTGTPRSSTNPLNGATPPSATSSTFPSTAVGTYHWTATYNGDANNVAVSSACTAEPVVITQATPTIATTPSAGGPVGSTGISDTATVSGGFTPTGNVTFNLFAPGDTGCTGTPRSSTNPLNGATPPSATSSTFPSTAVGTYHWTATYNGDANNVAVSSACTAEPVVITQATPTIATTPSAGGPVGSTGISDTATVSGGFTPTGNVTFNLFAPGDTGCTGTPRSSTNPLNGATPPSATSSTFPSTAVGTYHWTATYNGDANNVAVSSACTAEPVVITQATPTIATTPSAGGPVGSTGISDTATVSGGFTPTGNVTFNLFAPGDTGCTGTPRSSTNPLNGATPPSATSSTFPSTAVGTYHWTATYNGDANNVAVSSDCTAEPVVITQATPTIATTPSAGGPVGSTGISDTATVSGGFTPTGNVTFNLFAPGDTGCTGTPRSSTNPLNGATPPSATSSTFPSTAVGTYHWTATYNGDANNVAVSSALHS